MSNFWCYSEHWQITLYTIWLMSSYSVIVMHSLSVMHWCYIWWNVYLKELAQYTVYHKLVIHIKIWPTCDDVVGCVWHIQYPDEKETERKQLQSTCKWFVCKCICALYIRLVIIRLFLKLFEVWWTRSVLFLTGFTTYLLVMEIQLLPITGRCRTILRPWIGMTHSLTWLISQLVSLIMW